MLYGRYIPISKAMIPKASKTPRNFILAGSTTGEVLENKKSKYPMQILLQTDLTLSWSCFYEHENRIFQAMAILHSTQVHKHFLSYCVIQGA